MPDTSEAPTASLSSVAWTPGRVPDTSDHWDSRGLCGEQGRCECGNRHVYAPAGAAHAADRPRLARAWGSPWHDLALEEDSDSQPAEVRASLFPR